MRIVVVNGRKLQMTRLELLQILRHRFLVGFVLAVYCLVLLMQPFSGFFTLNVMTATLLFTAGAAIFALSQFGGMFLLDRLGMRVFTAPLMVFTAITTATSVVLLGDALDAGQPTTADLVVLYLFHICVFVGGELVFVTFLLNPVLAELGIATDQALQANVIAAPLPPTPAEAPVAEEDTTPQVAAPAKPEPITTPPETAGKLILLGAPIDPDALWAMQAQEHYVGIETGPGQRQLLRGRISDAETVLPKGLGLRVHRSHWVAARAIADLKQGRDQWVLTLRCGTEVPVARARRRETRAWVDQVLNP
jgi:hypothetical protein